MPIPKEPQSSRFSEVLLGQIFPGQFSKLYYFFPSLLISINGQCKLCFFFSSLSWSCFLYYLTVGIRNAKPKVKVDIKKLACGQVDLKYHFGEIVYFGHFKCTLTTQEEIAADDKRLIK